jgi:thioesterase domain-containing protein/acyl carrier protein
MQIYQNQLETNIAQIWQRILGINNIDLDDNFFELGGDSLIALEVMFELEEIVGIDLSLDTLLKAQTVRQLAALLDQKEKLFAWSSLVPIQPNGTKPPLFCVHPIGGNILDYFLLAQCLGQDQPSYGFQSLGLDGKQQPLTRVEDMASHYLNELRTLQPQGPYFLAGYSFGAMITFEMAQQLYAQGQEIGLLAFLDGTSPALPKTRPSLAKAIGIHLHNIWHLQPSERFDYINNRLTYRLNNSSKRDMLVSQWSTLGSLYPHLIDILDSNLEAMNSYTAKTYPGDAVLFRSKIQRIESSLEPDLGWAKLIAGNLEIHPISGAHFSVLKAPNIQTISEKLKSQYL